MKKYKNVIRRLARLRGVAFGAIFEIFDFVA